MITLFDYQQVALDLIVDAFRTRAMALAVMATGLGKTIVAAFWAKEELRKKRRGLFLCHDNGILEQAMGEFKKVIGDKAKFSPFFGSDKDFDADKADMVFASFQTYANWKIAFYENEFDFIIVDESHHGQARTFKEVILYFKPKKLLGITATPDRMDLKDIREIFGEEVVNYSLEEAIAKGWLTQVEYHIINDNLNHWKLKKILKGVLEKGERVSLKQLNETIFITKRDEEIAKVIQEYSGSSKKTIIFCENIDHAEKFKEYLPGALTYHSKVAGGAKENRRRLDAFREGTLQYILAVDKFNEGIDVPDAELVVFLRCTDSKIIFYQQLGRGLRKVFGKEKVTVLDFVANCERLIFIKELAQKTKEFAGNHFELSDAIIQVSGKAFDFIFRREQIDILEVIRRMNLRYIADHPHLRAEYSNKNPIPPEFAVAGTHRKYIWNCQKCGLEWMAQGTSRFIQKTGCPACAGLVAKPSEYLTVSKPELREYFSKINSIPFENLSIKNYGKDYWWRCCYCSCEFFGSILFIYGKPTCDVCYRRDKELDKKEREMGIKLEKEKEEMRRLERIRQCCEAKGKIPFPENQIEECIKCETEEWIAERKKNRAEKLKRSYATAKEAIKAAIDLGITDYKSYVKLFKQDPKLPFGPNDTYYEDSYIEKGETFMTKLKEILKLN